MSGISGAPHLNTELIDPILFHSEEEEKTKGMVNRLSHWGLGNNFRGIGVSTKEDSLKCFVFLESSIPDPRNFLSLVE